jgi:integrase
VALENLENLPEAFERRAPFRASWEKLIVWTLLDTGLRVAELAHLKKDNIDWQDHRLMIYGKGGPYGSRSKRRVIPLTARRWCGASYRRSIWNRRCGAL